MDPRQSKADEHGHALERTRSFDEEPKQPANIPNIIENALQTVDDAKSAASVSSSAEEKRESALTSDDVKYLFSGAPHFMLEKGRHNHWYPHVLFPWDSSLPIQDLWDRELLRHESFTLSTLHAHLPVPTNISSSNNKSKDGKEEESWQYDDGVKRPTYDLGIFEVPNMLSMNGKEPGAIGFRHFLEMATADAVRYKRAVPRGESFDPRILSNMPLTEAFDTLSHSKDAYSQCNQDVVLDRHNLLCEGPAAWKRIGVRDVSIKDIAERLERISDFRVEALTQQQQRPGKNNKITILEKESLESMHKRLYTKFLFPPPRGWDHHPHEELKDQIEVLTRVLAVKGAWLDLSLPEWRLRVGQILWEMPPHADGDSMDCCVEDRYKTKENQKANPLENGLERKWLLLQLLLAGELLLRLDAIVHLAVLQHSKDLSVTAQDMRELDKLRHGKVNWDILLFQRFSDNVAFKYVPKSHSSEQEQKQQKPSTSAEEAAAEGKHHSLRSKFGSISHHFPLHRSDSSRQSQESASLAEQDSVWECIVTAPRHPERQLRGISVFAEIIGWPGYETLEKRIRSNVQQKEGEPMTLDTVRSAYSAPVKREEISRLFSKNDAYSRDACHRYVVVHGNGQVDGTSVDDTKGPRLKIGGWLSRSWLTGLVMPGESIHQLLMATLLENDPVALRTLGTVANLHGGLSYGDGDWTWWSTKCIVGRVLAALEGSRACMGWVHANITPVADDDEKLKDTWFSVEGIQEALQKNTRIRQSTRMAIESSPLGRGRVASDTFTIPADDDNINPNFDVKLNKLSLSRRQEDKGAAEAIRKIFVADRASISFDITTSSLTTPVTESVEFPLTYNSIFISSYTCQPPRGSLAHTHDITGQSDAPLDKHADGDDADTKQHTHLPGHPLHKSYKYKHVPLQDLRPSTHPPVIDFSTPTSTPPTKESSSTSHPHHHHRTDSGEHVSAKTDKGATADSQAEKEQEQEPIWILDARFSRDKEVFARAWCAAVGVHALIGRAGRTCLACCVREARAVGVGVVIRVAKPVS